MSRVRLSVVEAGEELRGSAPPSFERLARRAAVESKEHRGVVVIASTLAARCVSTCVPPSVQAQLRASLEPAFLWVRNQASPKDAQAARAACFGAVSAFEAATKKAIVGAKPHLSGRGAPSLPLDPHADHVVARYAGLSAHFTVSAVCHALDAVTDPTSAPRVLQDIEGARAYQATGLGSARHPAFRKAAWDQANWEAERASGQSPEHRSSLGVQVFHEYLGGRWRAHADAERLKTSEFVAWALRGAPHP